MDILNSKGFPEHFGQKKFRELSFPTEAACAETPIPKAQWPLSRSCFFVLSNSTCRGKTFWGPTGPSRPDLPLWPGPSLNTSPDRFDLDLILTRFGPKIPFRVQFRFGLGGGVQRGSGLEGWCGLESRGGAQMSAFDERMWSTSKRGTW